MDQGPITKTGTQAQVGVAGAASVPGIKQGQALVKKFTQPKSSKEKRNMMLAGLVVVLVGIATGWVLSGTSRPSSGSIVPGVENSATEAGITDEATFRDTAEGELVEGGIKGEGTHHLVREGGESKYVYMTSTVIDLQGFVGKNVQVWGETISAQSAPWLMDVGKIKEIK